MGAELVLYLLIFLLSDVFSVPFIASGLFLLFL